MYRILRTNIVRRGKKATDNTEVTVDDLKAYRKKVKELYRADTVLFVYETIE